MITDQAIIRAQRMQCLITRAPHLKRVASVRTRIARYGNTNHVCSVHITG